MARRQRRVKLPGRRSKVLAIAERSRDYEKHRDKKRVNRKKAASRRAIQAYWKARVVDTYSWMAEAELDIEDARNDFMGCLNEYPVNNFGYNWHIEQAYARYDTYERMYRNACTRYAHACAAGMGGKK